MMRRTLGLAIVTLLLAASSLWAQPAATGNLYGKVSDESGAALPGATVTLSGVFGSRATVASTQGDFRFPGIPHGTHKLTVTLSGFATVNRSVVVAIGQ